MLAQLQEQYRDKGLNVLAINIHTLYSLKQWISFWKSTGAGEVIWAQDLKGGAGQKYNLVALGTEVIVDRQGRIAFRSDGPVGLARLRAEIDKLLSAQ